VGVLWVAPAFVEGGGEGEAISTDASNLRVANSYWRSRDARVVIVGSSLAHRLSEEFFETPGIKNLSFEGGSSLTGLEIIASMPKRPRVVLVEANVLSRPADLALVRDVVERRPAPLRIVRWILRPGDQKKKLNVEQILAAGPSTRHEIAPIYLKPASYTAESVKPNINNLKRLILDLRRSGSKVLLFDLPFAPELQHSTHRLSTNLAHAQFTDLADWLPLAEDQSQLRWSDGVHLDARSSIVIAREMDRALSKMP
jgi:hypothetical protein